MIVKPFHLCMYSVHILSICPMSRATNENERQLMRKRLCGYAVSQLLWTLCHSWRSIDRALMCPFIPPSRRSHFHGCIVLCASADCLCSVTLQTVWTLYYMLPSGPQSLRCLARLIHPSIHFPFTLAFTLTDDTELPVGLSECACLSHCGRKPEFREGTDTDPGPGIKPASFLLRCDSANHCTTMMPRLQVPSFVVHWRCKVYSERTAVTTQPQLICFWWARLLVIQNWRLQLIYQKRTTS